jgi:hypothetical protein
MMMQLDFFESEQETEMKAMREEMARIEASTHKVRKSLFAKHGELAKCYLDLKQRLEIIERGLCNGS